MKCNWHEATHQGRDSYCKFISPGITDGNKRLASKPVKSNWSPVEADRQRYMATEKNK